MPIFDYLLSFFLDFFGSHIKQFKPLEVKLSVMAEENTKKREQEIVDELEHEVEDLEEEFDQVNDENVSDSVRKKQQQVENILGEVHEQLEFLREISEEMPGNEAEEDQKE